MVGGWVLAGGAGVVGVGGETVCPAIEESEGWFGVGAGSIGGVISSLGGGGVAEALVIGSGEVGDEVRPGALEWWFFVPSFDGVGESS